MRHTRSSPWGLWLVAAAITGAVLLPVYSLCTQAFEQGLLSGLKLMLAPRFRELLGNTLLLMGSVLLGCLVLALPLAWCTTRTDLKWRSFWTLAGVLPLAIPSYMMAYVYLSIGGDNGLFAQVFGWKLQRINGFWGAWLVLTFCNVPYLFLNLRAGFLVSDQALEEASGSLGAGPWETFWRVQWPQLLPAIGAGSLLIGLHVMGNFEAVSLMRYKTFSWELFQVRMLDPHYAAQLSVLVLVITGFALWLEMRLLRRLRLYRVGSGAGRAHTLYRLGKMQPLIVGCLALLMLCSVILPVGTIAYWFFSSTEKVLTASEWRSLWKAALCSLQSSLPTALITAALSLPLVFLSVRFPSTFSRFVERVGYFGYAIAPIALALSLLFMALRVLPFLYLTMPLLVAGLTLHFLAESLGPVRSSLLQLPPRLEEAARALGTSKLGAFFRVTLPNLRKGLVVSAAMVFLSSMKELSLHLILSPTGYSSLAMEVWDKVENVDYAGAAPYALLILAFSASFVLLLFTQEQNKA